MYMYVSCFLFTIFILQLDIEWRFLGIPLVVQQCRSRRLVQESFRRQFLPERLRHLRTQCLQWWNAEQFRRPSTTAVAPWVGEWHHLLSSSTVSWSHNWYIFSCVLYSFIFVSMCFIECLERSGYSSFGAYLRIPDWCFVYDEDNYADVSGITSVEECVAVCEVRSLDFPLSNALYSHVHVQYRSSYWFTLHLWKSASGG